MISAKKAFAAMAVAGLSAVVALPAQALPPQGQPVPVAQALEELQREQWEPVIAAWGPLGGPEAPEQRADEGTIESTAKPVRPIFMILNQKGTNQWVAALKMGEQFLLQARGTDLKLLPLDNGTYKTVSYKIPVQNVPPGAKGKLCAADDKLDMAVSRSFGAVRVMEGVSSHGERVGFFVAPKSDKWLLSVGAEPGVSCIGSMGEGYSLNNARPEFIPEWRRNQMKP